MEIKLLSSESTAKRISDFLTSHQAFDQVWAPNEKAIVERAVRDSVQAPNHQYWYIEQDGQIIAAMGIRENKYGSGGYEMDQDYFSVHQNHRGKGIATQLLHEIEQWVKNKNGRYIHALSCDIDSYAPARKFYQKNGYQVVANIPNYYVAGEGRVDFFKEF